MLHLAATPYTLHFRKPAPTSRGALTTRNIWFVRAWDDSAPAITGWGEAGPLPGLSRDDRADFGDEVARFCATFSLAGYGAAAEALAAVREIAAAWPSLAFGIETALLDLAGGGRQILWETPFARGETGLPTHGLIWMDTPDGIVRQVEAKVAAGFDVIKMKIGALPFAEEVEILRRVRSAFPDVELRLDANGAFAPDEALHRLETLAAFDIAFVEQPVRSGQWDVMADICRQSPIPIALDEELIPVTDANQRRALLDAVRPHILILKPALLGGFSACETWIADSEMCGVQWIANSLLESNVGLNAICQWVSAAGGDAVHGLGSGTLFTNNIDGPIHLRGARLDLDRGHRWDFSAIGGPLPAVPHQSLS